MTTAQDVIDSFESSFQDKVVIPESLELIWLRKAVARYSTELESLSYDEESHNFGGNISGYAIDTLASYMKQYYMEREVSKVNKRVSIVTKDLSIDGSNGTKTAARAELEYVEEQSNRMTFNQKPTAYV